MSHPTARRRSRTACAIAALLATLASSFTIAQPATQPAPADPTPVAAPTKDPTDALFNPPVTSPVPDLDIQITKDDLQKLRNDPRTYVRGTLKENGADVGTVGIKLKGAAGSFREIDDRPALTVSFDKFKGTSETRGEEGRPSARLYHGLEKFHLNNSVQDESLLNEWVCAEVFRSAGYPAPRVAHARVSINGRDHGMYVLKESFDRDFLKRHFDKAAGGDAALYDGGFLQDINAKLERDVGKGEDTHADLHRLAAACAGDNLAVRWADLDRLLDVEAFLRYVALERMLAHWDGYSQNRNNYRVFFPRTGTPGQEGKARFIPHGMDQTFNDPGYPLVMDAAGMLVTAVMRNPAWRSAYHAEIVKQAEAFDTQALVRKINGVQARLQPALKKVNPDGGVARHQSQLARDLVRRIHARAQNIREQASRPLPKPLIFNVGQSVAIDRWIETAETEEAVHEDVQIDNATWKRLACPSQSTRTIASWRRAIILPPGRYTLAAAAKTEGVEPITGEDWPGVGAGVRLSGTSRTAPDALTGTASTTLAFDFDIDVEREVVLILELRAMKGSVAFKADSITLTRRPDAQQPKPNPAPVPKTVTR